MIKVVVADDHEMLREGLTQLIDDQPDMDVVASASNGLEALDRARETGADVILLDLTMPTCGGLEALRLLSREGMTKALVLSMHDDAHSVQACLDAGAAGFLSKQLAVPEIVHAIREVVRGRRYVSSGLVPASNGPTPTPSGVATALSAREQQVLELLAYGHTNREIAAALAISPKSIDSYRERLYEKLQLNGRAALVRYALKHGILKPEPAEPS